MNKIKFLYKFYFKKQLKGHYNWNLLFPFFGVIMGCMTVALTLAIMEGMEYAIFNKLKNVSFPAKLTHVFNSSNCALENYLIDKKIDYLNGMEDQVLIIKDSTFRLTTIHAIDNFKSFRKKVFDNNLKEVEVDSQLPVIYMGKPLALKLDITIGDTIDIASPKHINIITGLPPIRAVIVGGTYKLEVLDYDQKHIFTELGSVKDFLPDNRSLYYLYEVPGENIINAITHDFPGIHLQTWKDAHHSFISAMKLEKIAYSIISFFIVIIAGFTLMSMMSLAVIRKVPQIGILRAMGANRKKIGAIFIVQAFIIWMLSSSTGIILSLIIIELDKYYHLVEILFPSAVFFDFPLILENFHILLIMVVSLITLLSAAIYPSIKAAHLDAVDAIGYR